MSIEIAKLIFEEVGEITTSDGRKIRGAIVSFQDEDELKKLQWSIVWDRVQFSLSLNPGDHK
jgi:hypothetical protein